jgi:hypothetical protein
MNVLTPEQEEMVEQELVELFAVTQHEVAERLGMTCPDDGWSEADGDRIMAEIKRVHRPRIEKRLITDAAFQDDD